ncbi:MAG: insulinase family protein [Ignavibacteria bacterium]|nr:insulinase family protein [Ignavibacteria bacterium]
MKNFILSLFVLVVVWGTMSTAKTKSGKILPFEYQKVVLPNGMKAILIPFDSPGLVAYYTVVRTGSRDEWEEGKSGFAHFFEHMMFRGTDRFPGGVYDSIITSMGASANAYTSDDLTVFHLNIANDYLEKVMDLESDRFRNLKYSKEEFQTESGAVYGEYRKGRTSPWEVAYEVYRDMAFDKHTYKHTTIGFERDIKEMPNMYDYSLSFYNRYYRPTNVVVVVVGDIDVKKTTALLKKYYGPWSGSYTEPKIQPEPAQTAPRMKEVTYDGKTLPIMLMGYKCDAFDAKDKQYVALMHFAELCFGETSQLYKKLVLDEQKVQAIEASHSLARDPYLFEISVQVKNVADIDYVTSEIRKAIKQFADNPVDAKKLADLKKRGKYSFLMGLDNPDAIASRMPHFITLTGDIDVINELYTTLDSITPQDLQNAVKHYFVPQNENLVILKGAEK